MRKLGDWLWVFLPLRVARWSRTLAAALADGAYLRGTPTASVLIPVAAFVVGVVYSLAQGSRAPTFTVSVFAIMLFAVVSGFGAALGFWLTLGYALGDQVASAPAGLFRYLSVADQLAVRASWVVSALVLALLAVMIPLAVSGIRMLVGNRLRAQPSAALVVSALAAGVAAVGAGFSWIQVAPVLIRPVFTWPDGGSPTVDAIAPMQRSGWMIVAAIVVAAVVRTVVERLLGSMAPPLQVENSVFLPPNLRRSMMTAVGSAILLTFLFSGVYEGFAYAGIAFVGLLIASALRHVVLPRAGGYAVLVGKVPLIIRLAVLVGSTYLAGRYFLDRAKSSHDETFTFVLWTVLVGAFVSAMLLPSAADRSPRSRREIDAISAVGV